MLFGGMRESQPGVDVIELKDERPQAFTFLLSYIYTGKVKLSQLKVRLTHCLISLALPFYRRIWLNAGLCLLTISLTFDVCIRRSRCWIYSAWQTNMASRALSQPFLSTWSSRCLWRTYALCSTWRVHTDWRSCASSVSPTWTHTPVKWWRRRRFSTSPRCVWDTELCIERESARPFLSHSYGGAAYNYRHCHEMEWPIARPIWTLNVTPIAVAELSLRSTATMTVCPPPSWRRRDACCDVAAICDRGHLSEFVLCAWDWDIRRHSELVH